MRAYVGADWSATEVVCAVVGERGEPLRMRGSAAPTLTSVREFVQRAREMVDADEVYVTIEAGARQWVRLFHAAGAVVFVADPKQARRFAESQCSSGAKDDRRDARSLADMCRSQAHRLEPWEADEADMEELDVVGGLHERTTKSAVRVKQRLRDQLREHMPLVENALPSDLCTRWVEEFLRQAPTPWHARQLDRETFDRLLANARKATRERLWHAIQQTEAPWLDQRRAEAFAFAVRCTLDEMALLRDQLAEIERRLDATTKSMASRPLLESMDGIAVRMATSLIQFGFRDGAPPDRDAASVRMGASPVFVGSARKRNGEPKGTVRMRRSTQGRARRTTYLLGRLTSQRLGWARAMYAHAMSRGQTPATAYRRIARCVLRILTAMLRDGEPYDDARYVASLKAKGVPWAEALDKTNDELDPAA